MSDGVVVNTADLTVLDTRAVPWESSGYVPGSLSKSLSRDEDGDPTIVLRWMGRMNQVVRDTPMRGYHHYRQTSLVVGGQDPQWEYDEGVWEINPDAYKVFRRGVFSDRLPPAEHGGSFPRLPVPTMWSFTFFSAYEEGAPDAFLGAKESAALTEQLPVPGKTVANPLPPMAPARTTPQPPNGVIYDRERVKVWQTQDLDWDPHPLLPGSFVKSLAWVPWGNPAGDPSVVLWALQPGTYPSAELPCRFRNSYREYFYVVEGEVTFWRYDSADAKDGTPISLKEGFFVDRRPGSIYGFEAEPCSPTGAVLLHFRAREGMRFLKPDENWPLSVSLSDRTTFTRPPEFNDIYLPPPPPSTSAASLEGSRRGLAPPPDSKS